MPSVSKILNNFAQSKVGQNIYNKVLDPKNEKFINSSLPVAQQALAEIAGVAITAFNPKMPEQQKKTQLINHGMKAATNLTLVAAVSKTTADFASSVASKITAPESAKSGIKIGLPLIVATLTSRYLIPVFLNNISTRIREHLERKCPIVKNISFGIPSFKGFMEQTKRIDYRA